MQRLTTLASIVLLASSLFAVPANALFYIGSRSINSIEWTVFDADVIVRAERIGEMKRFDAKPLPRSNPLIASTQPHRILIWTLKVSEVIKGPKELAGTQSLTFASEEEPRITGDAVYFLVSVAHFYNTTTATTQMLESFGGQQWVLDTAGSPYRSYEGLRTPTISLDPVNEAFVFDSGGQVIKGTEAILNAVRHEAHNPPAEQFGKLRLAIPEKSQFFHDTYPIDYALDILVDRRAEARAAQWIKSSSPMDRLNGARVLAFWRSPENIARLENLLGDSSLNPVIRPRFDPEISTASGKWNPRSYPIRQAAWNALYQWGVSPTVIPLGADKYPAASVRPWVPGAGGIALALVSLAILLSAWIKRGRFAAGLVMLNYFLLLLFFSLWILSQWKIVDVVFRSWPDSDRHELALIDGKIRWLKIENWPDPTPAAITFVPRTSETLEDWRPQSSGGYPYNRPVFQAEYAGKLGFAFSKDQIGIRDFGDRVYRSYAVPLWAMVMLFSVLPAVKIFRMMRKRRRAGRNCCVDCGYDLRASVGRCPECGREF